jgi:hypothetical protein
MRFRVLGALMMVSVLVGCSGKGSVTAPTVDAPSSVATNNALRTASTVGGWDVEWPASFGQAIVHNGGAGANFTFIVWDATDYDNQVNVAQITNFIAGTFTQSVGFEVKCGRRYQRDVYKGLDGKDPRYTQSDVNNADFRAPGVFLVAPRCDEPTLPPVVTPPPVVVVPPPPPPVETRCLDHEANNYGGLLPCTFGEGGIGQDPTDPPPPPPPPPPVEPAKVLFCHVDVNVTGGKNPKTIVHEQQVGGQNGIPQTAIDAGHTAGAFHGVTTEHFYDYYGVCDGRGIGPQ